MQRRFSYFDRSKVGIKKYCLNERKINLLTTNNKLNVRIILDKYTVEIFLNNDYKTMTSYICK